MADKKKILLIDDDEEMCDEISELLENEGYSVDVAFDGTKGENLIRSCKYHIVFLDLRIPGIRGVDILKRTKARTPELKIIILTGKPLSDKMFKKRIHEDEDERLLTLADGVMNKPFEIKKFLKKIKDLLAAAK